MKYIFDFDDVLFKTTKHRLEHMFVVLQKAGISEKDIEEYYKKERTNFFSLKNLLAHFLMSEDVYEEIMKEIKNFLNDELIEMIKKLGRENCYLVTAGHEEFQKEKILRAGINPLFAEIVVTPGTKKEAVENICAKFKNEDIVFIDDKKIFFEDLDFKKYPNLKTILYTGQNTEDLLKAIRNFNS